ncbi:NADH-quinone oxidoreductase subunit C [Bacteroidota bacterium]
MKKPEEIFQLLKDEFQNAILEIQTELPVEPLIIVDPLKIDKVSLYLRDTEGLEFDTLMVLSGVDDANGEKIKEDDESEIIKGGTLSVYYHLDSMTLKHKVTLKVSSPRDKPEIVSVESVWRTADWHEREVFDMYGIKFLNHPDLRRILMPEDWEESYPLRKDYKNPEFYKGMKVPY